MKSVKAEFSSNLLDAERRDGRARREDLASGDAEPLGEGCEIVAEPDGCGDVARLVELIEVDRCAVAARLHGTHEQHRRRGAMVGATGVRFGAAAELTRRRYEYPIRQTGLCEIVVESDEGGTHLTHLFRMRPLMPRMRIK